MTTENLRARRCWRCFRRGDALPLTRTELGTVYSNLQGPPSKNSPNRYGLIFNRERPHKNLQNEVTALVISTAVEPYKQARDISVRISFTNVSRSVFPCQPSVK